MGRTKYVHDESMVAHLWANQSQDSARKPGSNNFFFEGDTIYSYGRHFPIARHTVALEVKDGQRTRSGVKVPVILFTTRRYSVTTSNHISSVARAIPRDAVIYYVNDPAADYPHNHKENFEALIREAVSLTKQARKARGRKAELLARARRTVQDANEYALAFGLRFRRNPDALEGLAEAQASAERKKTAAQRKWAEEAVERQRQAESIAVKLFPEYLKRWRENRLNLEAFDSDFPEFTTGNARWHMNELLTRKGLYFRFSRDGRAVESTLGAEVPARSARKLFEALYTLARMGTETEEKARRKADLIGNLNIFKIGDFGGNNVLEVDPTTHAHTGGITIGCHTIPASEIDAFAEFAGWTRNGVLVTEGGAE